MTNDPKRAISLPVAAPMDDGPWYQAGLRFECTQCGNCCSGGPGFVWLTDADIERIAAFLNLSVPAFTSRYVRLIGDQLGLTEKPGYDCIFLNRADGKSMCGIYPVRPMQCRTWPFWDMNLKSPDAWVRASGRCPGMRDKTGPVYPLEHIEKCRKHPESP